MMRLIGTDGQSLLTDTEHALLCVALNTKPGPFADRQSLPFFTRDYARKMLKSTQKKMTAKGRAFAESAIKKLEG